MTPIIDFQWARAGPNTGTTWGRDCILIIRALNPKPRLQGLGVLDPLQPTLRTMLNGTRFGCLRTDVSFAQYET